jgi:hypothetical protein
MIPFLSAQDSNESRKEEEKKTQNSDQRKLVLVYVTVAPAVVV